MSSNVSLAAAAAEIEAQFAAARKQIVALEERSEQQETLNNSQNRLIEEQKARVDGLEKTTQIQSARIGDLETRLEAYDGMRAQMDSTNQMIQLHLSKATEADKRSVAAEDVDDNGNTEATSKDDDQPTVEAVNTAASSVDTSTENVMNEAMDAAVGSAAVELDTAGESEEPDLDSYFESPNTPHDDDRVEDPTTGLYYWPGQVLDSTTGIYYWPSQRTKAASPSKTLEEPSTGSHIKAKPAVSDPSGQQNKVAIPSKTVEQPSTDNPIKAKPAVVETRPGNPAAVRPRGRSRSPLRSVDPSYHANTRRSRSPLIRSNDGVANKPSTSGRAARSAAHVRDLTTVCTNCGRRHGSALCFRPCRSCGEKSHVYNSCPWKDDQICGNCGTIHNGKSCKKECRYCRISGHFFQKCRYKDAEQCPVCGLRTHLPANCPWKNEVYCRKCMRDHRRDPCRAGCKGCGGLDHLWRHCNRRIDRMVGGN